MGDRGPAAVPVRFRDSAARGAGRALRGARRTALVAAAAAMTFAPGCRGDGDPDPMAQDKVVFEGGGSAMPVRSQAEALADAERAFAAADAAWRSGDPLSAMAIANQALRRGVPGEYEAKLRDLRVRARAAVVTDRIVRIRAVAAKDVVADGDPVVVRLVLTNLAPAPFRSPRSEAGSSDAVFRMSVHREDHDAWGNVRSSDSTWGTPLPADLDIPPGGEREVSVTLEPSMVALGHTGFSVIRIGGTYRPVVSRLGESEFFDALEIEPATFRILQKGWEQLASDPLGSLRQAIARRSPPHLVAAAELLAPPDRPAARTALTAAIERDPPLEPSLKAALTRLDELDGRPGARP